MLWNIKCPKTCLQKAERFECCSNYGLTCKWKYFSSNCEKINFGLIDETPSKFEIPLIHVVQVKTILKFDSSFTQFHLKSSVYTNVIIFYSASKIMQMIIWKLYQPKWNYSNCEQTSKGLDRNKRSVNCKFTFGTSLSQYKTFGSD